MATGDLIEWETPRGLRGTTTRRGLALDGRNDLAVTFGTQSGRSTGIVTRIPENGTVRTVAAAGTERAVRFADDVRSNAPRSARAALAANPTTSQYSSFNGPEIPDVVGTLSGVYGEENRQRLDAQRRTAGPASGAGTGNS